MSAATADVNTLRQRKGGEKDKVDDDAPAPLVRESSSTIKGSGFVWLDIVLAFFGVELSQKAKKDRKKGLGTAKYREWQW